MKAKWRPCCWTGWIPSRSPLCSWTEITKTSTGYMHRIRPSVLHLMRGQLYDFDGLKIFTFGGASSHDMDGGILESDDLKYRKKKKMLEDIGLSYRINHVSWWTECLTDYLEEIKRTLRFKKWFFGYYHDNRNVSAEEILIWEQIVRVR